MTTRRWILLVAGLSAALGGGFFAGGEPRLTLLNTTIRVEYPRRQAAAALGAAVGVALLAAAGSRRWLRIACGVVAVGVVLLAAERLRYRLDAGSDGLVSRGLLGETTLPWREVARVEKGPDVILVWGSADAQVRVTTSDFTPDQRATLERAVARRVQEAQAAVKQPR